MNLTLSHHQSHKQSQTISQRTILANLISLRCELQSPVPPCVVRGIEGLEVADALLKERHATGILIGGLAETVWKKEVTQEDLFEHKDVDVLVLNEDFVLREKFEDGIDWWLPKKDRLLRRSDFGIVHLNASWWENGNSIVLSFYAQTNEILPSGLFIPRPSWIVEMRWEEAIANLDPRVTVEDDLEQVEFTFRKNLTRRMGHSLPPFLRERFERQILPQNYRTEVSATDPITIFGQEFADRAAITGKVIRRNYSNDSKKSLIEHFDQLTLLLSRKDCDFGGYAKHSLPILIRNRQFWEIAEDTALALSVAGFTQKKLKELNSQLLLLDGLKIPKQSSRLREHYLRKLKSSEAVWKEVRAALGIVEEILFKNRQSYEFMFELNLHDRDFEPPAYYDELS